MANKKRKIRIVIGIILFIFVGLIYLNIVGVLFPNLIPKEDYKFRPINISKVSNIPEVKIAFFGDQGINSNSRDVIELVKEENVDLIMLLGDFDYENNPNKFRDMYESIYGDKPPLLAVVGNHDVSEWVNYKSWMKDLKVDNLNCEGEYGEAFVCNYGPVSFIISAIGTLPGEHMKFLEDVLPKVDNSWKICAWHKNYKGYQVGGKKTEVDLGAYELCGDNGAIIMTGHEHTYSRTHGLNDVTNFVVGDSVSPYDISNNSMIFVSGLGGRGVRDTHDDIKDIWGSIYSEQQGAKAGALICTFKNTTADCEFVNTDREVVDKFKLLN